MTAGPPDGPALARWWDRVAPLRPQSIWVGTLDLVHYDAPLRVLRSEPLDPLHRLLLRRSRRLAPRTWRGSTPASASAGRRCTAGSPSWQPPACCGPTTITL